MSLTPGAQVGRYRLARMIAQGGMAEVYRADQELTPGFYRPVALKVIRPEYAGSSDFREMFLDEARTACTLSHPNIVHIYEVGEADGLLFMAMELVPGETLAAVARRLRDRGERFADEGLLAIGVYVCSALEAVHALQLPGEGHVNLVHRDVSPHNLLLGPAGSLKLIDFGIAKAAHNRNLTSPGITKGKAGYFSPEQAMGKALDGRSDLFSLGITLYKLAYGATPFDDYKDHHSRNTALVHGRFLPLRRVCAGLPEGFYNVVDKALEIRPEHRWADARQMREALEQVAISCGVQLGPSSLAYYVAPPDEGESVSGARSAAVQPPPRAQQTVARTQRLDPIVPHGSAADAPVPPKDGPRTMLDVPAPKVPSDGRVRTASPTLEQTRVLADGEGDAAPHRRRLAPALAGAGALLGLSILAGWALSPLAPWAQRQELPLAEAEVAPPDSPALGGERGSPSTVVAIGPVETQPGTQIPERPGSDSAVEEAPRPEAQEDADEGPTRIVASARPREARGDARPPRASRGGGGGAASSSSPKPLSAAKPPPSEKGEGLLRIGTVPDGQVRIPGQPWESTPLNRKMPAGRYRVELRSPGEKQGSCQVDVHPDRRVILRYDFKTGACDDGTY